MYIKWKNVPPSLIKEKPKIVIRSQNINDMLKAPIFKIRVNNKTEIPLLMNYVHLEGKCRTLMKALKNNHKINDNINWSWKGKQYGKLLQDIAMTCIIVSESFTIFFPFFFTKKMKEQEEQIYINNRVLFLKLLFQNKRIIYHCMINEKKWKSFFVCLNDLMISKFIMSPKYTELAAVFTRTFFYWTYDHVYYLIDNNFLQSLSKALINGYFHQQRRDSKLRLLIDFIIKIFYILGKNKHHDASEYDYGMRFYSNYILNASEKLSKTKRKSAFNNYLFQINKHTKQMNEFKRYEKKGMREPKFQFHLNTRLIKICANKKCKIYKNQKNNSSKLKICKGCKAVYYCSHKC